ncbi:hypothetical protein [Abyssisolibacter fermentans]|uniref:hypothetical protein n=1 Tax=Abyssisolibacter fermentans TaxID=1766203 RepID=UPI000836DFC3|nr:hypothetical protein [Abyssisolibacter fermentans]
MLFIQDYNQDVDKFYEALISRLGEFSIEIAKEKIKILFRYEQLVVRCVSHDLLVGNLSKMC